LRQDLHGRIFMLRARDDPESLAVHDHPRSYYS